LTNALDNFICKKYKGNNSQPIKESALLFFLVEKINMTTAFNGKKMSLNFFPEF